MDSINFIVFAVSKLAKVWDIDFIGNAEKEMLFQNKSIF